MRKWVERLGGGLLLLLTVGLGVDALTYPSKAWIADYGGLKRDMAQGYANLDWMVQRRGLDLVALDRQTTERLRNAHSRIRAYRALGQFVAAFRDPHLEITLGRSGGSSSQAGASAEELCAGSGDGGEPAAFHPSLRALPGWQPLQSPWIAAAVQGGNGFLRIASFSEWSYPEACRRAGKPGMSERALQLATRAALQQQIRTRLQALRERGAKRLIIDLTGNGGGSDWATEAAALFSTKPLRRRERLLTGPDCDRSAIWRGDPPPCSVFRAPPAEFVDLAGQGAWDGPVLILADGGTASAAEDFIVWLHGSGAARLIGQRTMGAGCGYVDGGTNTRLNVAPITVRMPNCARYLMDGTNEIEGIKPDVELPLGTDGFAPAFARALD